MFPTLLFLLPVLKASSFFKKKFIYLTVLSLTCGMWDFSLQCTDSLVMAHHAVSLVMLHGLRFSVTYGVLVPCSETEAASLIARQILKP